MLHWENMRKNIAIFFGGTSPEHEISILTGVQAFHAIDTEKYEPIPVFVDQDGQFFTGIKLTDTANYENSGQLLDSCTQVSFIKEKDIVVMISKSFIGIKKTPIDCAFLAFHGAYGEGGTFQGFCETLGLPYTSSDTLGASLCMDKVSMKQVLERENIPMANYAVALEKDFLEKQHEVVESIERKTPYPVFIKPSNGGSSIGVNRAKNRTELVHGLEVAFAFDSKVLIEQEFAKDTEINISYLGLWNDEIQTSVSEEVYSDNEFLDFENKYLKGSKSKKVSGSKGMASTNRTIPAQISPAFLTKLQRDGEKAFQALCCAGVVRIDFLVNKKTEEYVLVEVNTIPGSLAFYLWQKTNVSFTELTTRMIELAFKKKEMRESHARKFTPQIFKNL